MAHPEKNKAFLVDREKLHVKGDGFQLTPVARGDVEGLYLHMQDKRLTSFLAWAPHKDITQTAAVVDALIAAMEQDAAYHWTLRVADEVAGLVSLIDLKRRHLDWTLDRAELAYWLGVPFQGQGLATAMCREVLGLAFSQLRLHKVIVMHASGNHSSARLIDRLGFRYVGEERQAFLKADRWYDLKRYEMLAQDFETSKR